MRKARLNAIACGQDRELLSSAERETVAQVLSWDRRQKISPDEVLFLWVDHPLVWVQLSEKCSFAIYVPTFLDIRRQQLEQIKLEDTSLEPCFEVKPFIDATTGIAMHRLYKGCEI